MTKRVLMTILGLCILLVWTANIYGCGGNQDPVAVLLNNPSAVTNRAVTFYGCGSYDPDGSITEYQWDFSYNAQEGFQNEYSETAADAPDGAFDGVARFDGYSSNGSRQVMLKVFDNGSPQRHSDITYITINVYNRSNGTPIYVDYQSPCSSENEDGLSWSTAYKDLQDALAEADADGKNEIWVAEGTYKPDLSDPGERSLFFDLVADVNVYGGFDPTIGDDLWSERDSVNNKTILSGDIDEDELTDADNSYNVVTAKLDAGLDGFTIERGYANILGGGITGGSYEACTIRNCVITDNSAPADGAGMFVAAYSNHRIVNCVFSGNTADSDNDNSGDGGAIANGLYDSYPTLINCVFTGNTAENGGAIYNDRSDPILINCTFSGNSAASDGDSMYNEDSDPKLTNCILWDNSPVYNDNSTPVYKHCDVKGCGGSGENWVPGYGTDGGDNIDIDPEFDTPGDPDGDDGDFMTSDDGLRLDYDSPCIDVADNDSIDEPKDVKRDARIFNGVVDMGAYEYCTYDVIYVDADASTGGDGSDWAKVYKSLQDALDVAVDGDEIWVADGTYKPTTGTDRTKTFALKSGVDLYGGFDSSEKILGQRDWASNVTILSGDIGTTGVDTDNSYNVIVGAASATLDGFTVKKGYADHASTAQYQCGGGMYNEDVSPMVTNCIFNNNSAFYGGGMFNDSSSPTIKNCIFYDNKTISGSGGDGAAIYCYDYSDATIENCTISQNVSDDVAGGILAYYYSDPQINNSIIVYNEDSIGYSDIDAYGSSAVIVNYSDYGIPDADGATITLQNCISVAPLFAANDDFHLKSAEGRWNGSGWTDDAVTSPCINGGDPLSTYSNEPTPNGSRINMGAYGNTAEASKSDLYPFSYSLQTNDIYALPTEAAWSISGGSVNMSNLVSGQIIMIPAGTYTVSFACNNLSPYIVDSEGQSKVVTSSSINYYTATYQACGALGVSTFCPATLGYGGSAWGRFSYDAGSTWNVPYNYTLQYVKVFPDSYTVEFEDYSLLNTPDDITNVPVSAYNYVQISRTYLLNKVYVEPVSGNDSNIGTSGSPVATVTNAAEKVKTSGTVYVTNYESEFWHEGAQEYRGKITENVTLDKHVIIQYTGPHSFVHITGSHTINSTPSLVGVIFEQL